MSWTRAGLGVLAVLAIQVMACSNRTSELRNLDGREFISESVMGKTLVPGTEIRLSFDDGELNAHAGCNHLFGSYRIEDDVLKVDGLGGTAIGCDPALQAQDDWLIALFTDRPAVELDGPRLTLSSDQVTLVLLDRE